MVLGLAEGASPVEVSKKILAAAASKGLGLIFGTTLIRRMYDTEGRMLDDLSSEIKNPLVFTITSNPLATDAFEIFEKQLNPWTVAHRDRSELLRFLEELWAVDGIAERIFVIWESMIPSARDMPQYAMNVKDFQSWLLGYYKKELTGAGKGGGQGIFRLKQ